MQLKNQMVLTRSALLLALSALFFLSCGKEDAKPKNEDPFQLEANLLMGSHLFNRTFESRDLEHVFEVLEVDRENDVLHVHVKGGGDAESYQFIWDGRVQESYPMGIRLIMVYDNTNADFDPSKEMTVTVNLQKIIGDRNHVDDYHFRVINGSKMQTVTLNPDGTTTSEGG